MARNRPLNKNTNSIYLSPPSQKKHSEVVDAIIIGLEQRRERGIPLRRLSDRSHLQKAEDLAMKRTELITSSVARWQRVHSSGSRVSEAHALALAGDTNFGAARRGEEQNIGDLSGDSKGR